MITNSAKNIVANFEWGGVQPTPVGTYYLGLSTTPITEDGTGFTEPVGNGYARVAVTNNKTSFSQATNGKVTNAIPIQFPESTGAWGTITYVFLASTSTGSNVVFYDALPSSRIVQANSTVYFEANSMTFQVINPTN